MILGVIKTVQLTLSPRLLTELSAQGNSGSILAHEKTQVSFIIKQVGDHKPRGICAQRLLDKAHWRIYAVLRRPLRLQVNSTVPGGCHTPMTQPLFQAQQRGSPQDWLWLCHRLWHRAEPPLMWALLPGCRLRCYCTCSWASWARRGGPGQARGPSHREFLAPCSAQMTRGQCLPGASEPVQRGGNLTPSSPSDKP